MGQRGERAAARWLKRKGYLILERGVRSRFGELDLIAVDRRTLVFVEVKTRTTDDMGAAVDAVDPNKQKRMTQLALAYLRRNHLLECSARFDTIAVSWPSGRRQPMIEHIVDAFEPVDRYQMFS